MTVTEWAEAVQRGELPVVAGAELLEVAPSARVLAEQLAAALLAAACADSRPGLPLAQRLVDAAPGVLGPELAS